MLRKQKKLIEMAQDEIFKLPRNRVLKAMQMDNQHRNFCKNMVKY